MQLMRTVEIEYMILFCAAAINGVADNLLRIGSGNAQIISTFG